MLITLQNVLMASITPIQIKIADFGISAHQQGSYLQTLCGTLSYQAPEQLGLLPQRYQSRRGYTKAVDLWALGVLLHELVTLKLPFQEFDAGTMMSGLDTVGSEDGQIASIDMGMLRRYCIGSDPFPDESLKAAEISEEGISLVKSLLVANPKQRVSAVDAQCSPWLTGTEVAAEHLKPSTALETSKRI